MKKLVSVLLCAILVLSLCSVTASAAETDYLEASSTVDVQSGTVVLVLKAKQPLTNAAVRVDFDSSDLTFTGIEVNGTVSNYKTEEGQLRFRTAVSTANTMEAGETVATITFGVTGSWNRTTAAVTVENWNASIGVNAGMEVVITRSRFVDVTPDQWFYEAVERMAADGYIKGVDDNHFGPALPMNRASFVTVLGRMDGNEDTQAETCFVDVPYDSFYSGHVAWAVKHKITNGVDATHFAPGASINRAQMVTFLYRYVVSEGADVTVADPEAVLAKFPDASELPQWAVEPFAWAIENGIINGMDGTLNPNGISNRAQVAVMLYRFFYEQ